MNKHDEYPIFQLEDTRLNDPHLKEQVNRILAELTIGIIDTGAEIMDKTIFHKEIEGMLQLLDLGTAPITSRGCRLSTFGLEIIVLYTVNGTIRSRRLPFLEDVSHLPANKRLERLVSIKNNLEVPIRGTTTITTIIKEGDKTMMYYVIYRRFTMTEYPEREDLAVLADGYETVRATFTHALQAHYLETHPEETFGSLESRLRTIGPLESVNQYLLTEIYGLDIHLDEITEPNYRQIAALKWMRVYE